MPGSCQPGSIVDYSDLTSSVVATSPDLTRLAQDPKTRTWESWLLGISTQRTEHSEIVAIKRTRNGKYGFELKPTQTSSQTNDIQRSISTIAAILDV